MNKVTFKKTRSRIGEFSVTLKLNLNLKSNSG